MVMRHAESEANVRREYLDTINSAETHLNVGSRDVDVPLTRKGEEQARTAGRYLRDRYPPFDAVYVSPYRRTRQTADLVLAENPLALRDRIIEERLREKEFGIFEGLTKKGIVTLHPEEAGRKKVLGKYYYRPPGGESYPDVNLRVHSFLGTLARERTGDRVLVVTHSVVVLCFRRLLERMEENEVIDLDRRDEVRNASLLVYEEEPREGGAPGLVRKAWNLTPAELTSV
jgi:broad specificity phosphatase PhoE